MKDEGESVGKSRVRDALRRRRHVGQNVSVALRALLFVLQRGRIALPLLTT